MCGYPHDISCGFPQTFHQLVSAQTTQPTTRSPSVFHPGVPNVIPRDGHRSAYRPRPPRGSEGGHPGNTGCGGNAFVSDFQTCGSFFFLMSVPPEIDWGHVIQGCLAHAPGGLVPNWKTVAVCTQWKGDGRAVGWPPTAPSPCPAPSTCTAPGAAREPWDPDGIQRAYTVFPTVT